MREFLAHLALATFRVPGFRFGNYTSTRRRTIRHARLAPVPSDFPDGLSAGAEITAQHEQARREQKQPGFIWP